MPGTLIFTDTKGSADFTRRANIAKDKADAVLTAYESMSLPAITTIADLISLIEDPVEFINNASVSIEPLRSPIFHLRSNSDGGGIFMKENPTVFEIDAGAVVINATNLTAKLEDFKVYTADAGEDTLLARCQALCDALNVVVEDAIENTQLYWDLHHLPKHLPMVQRVGAHGDFIPNYKFVKNYLNPKS